MEDLSALKIDREKSSKRKRARSVGNPWPLRIVVLVILAGLAWVFYRPIAGFVDRFRLPQVRVALVAESHPASVGAVSGTAANGYIVAARRAALSADTPGRIVAMNVTEGSIVKKGDVVARLYFEEYAAALARAKSDTVAAIADVRRSAATIEAARAEQTRRERGVDVAKAQNEEAEAAQRLTKTRFDRTKNLHDGGIASDDELEAAEADLQQADARARTTAAQTQAAMSASEDALQLVKVAQASHEVAEARQAVAEAAERQATATLDKTYVRAPFDGIVVLKDAEVGEVVSPNSQGGGSARGSVCTMVDFDSLEVQADVPETSIKEVRIGAPANIYLDAYPGRTYPGKVSRIWPTASRQKASVEVRVVFEKRDQDLRPDLGVRVVFLGDEDAPATGIAEASAKQILVPSEAVVEVGGRSGAFVLERDTVKFQIVEAGTRRGGKVSIRSGLKPGQRIVLDPPGDLNDGSRVQVLDNK